MAQFKDVFSTTWKVLAALFLISMIVGVIIAILGGLGTVMVPAKSEPSSVSAMATAEDQAADGLRSTMPKSRWDWGMARATKNHCITEGMSKEEVVKAVAEPTERRDYSADVGSIWEWHLPSGKCLKYDGDNCIEQGKNSQTILFTPKGHVRGQPEGCETISGRYIYFSNSHLFPVTDPDEARGKAVARETAAEREAAATEAAVERLAAQDAADRKELSLPCPAGTTRTLRDSASGSDCK